MRISAPIPNIEVLAPDLKRLRDEFSIFEDFNVIGRWGTQTDFVTNFAPVISPINRIPGLKHVWRVAKGRQLAKWWWT